MRGKRSVVRAERPGPVGVCLEHAGATDVAHVCAEGWRLVSGEEWYLGCLGAGVEGSKRERDKAAVEVCILGSAVRGYTLSEGCSAGSIAVRGAWVLDRWCFDKGKWDSQSSVAGDAIRQDGCRQA